MFQSRAKELSEKLGLEKSIYCRLRLPISKQYRIIATVQDEVTEKDARRKIEDAKHQGYEVICLEESPIDLYEAKNFMLLFETVMKVSINNNKELKFCSDDPREELIEYLLMGDECFGNVVDEIYTSLKSVYWYYNNEQK